MDGGNIAVKTRQHDYDQGGVRYTVYVGMRHVSPPFPSPIAGHRIPLPRQARDDASFVLVHPPVFESQEDVTQRLTSQRYLCDRHVTTAVYLAGHLSKPLLVDWVRALVLLNIRELSDDLVDETLSTIIKFETDIQKARDELKRYLAEKSSQSASSEKEGLLH
jgi:hypothetical protein